VLYANAGVFHIVGKNWPGVFSDLVFGGLTYFFVTGGQFMVQPVGMVTKDGYGDVFLANVFGHYLLVRIHTSICLFFCFCFNYPASRRAAKAGERLSQTCFHLV